MTKSKIVNVAILVALVSLCVGVTQVTAKPAAHKVNLSADTANKFHNATVFTDKGTISGSPLTSSGDVSLSYALKPKEKTSKTTITITSSAGNIYGIANLTYTTDAKANSIVFTGPAKFLSGTGAYKGIKAANLKFTDKNTLNGQNGRVTITGTAFY